LHSLGRGPTEKTRVAPFSSRFVRRRRLRTSVRIPTTTRNISALIDSCVARSGLVGEAVTARVSRAV
jgi:hypothetical protein